MPQTTCVVEGCTRTIKNKTLALCDPHYKRHWRNGSTNPGVPLAEARAASVPAADWPDETRTCQTCGVRKELTEFHRDSRSPLGRRKVCRPCRVAVEMERHKADRDRIISRVRAFRQANPEHVRRQEAASYERHREARIASAVALSHERRALIQGAARERGITINALRHRDGDHCHYCQTTMEYGRYAKGTRPNTMATLEHIIPISRGGTHTWDNCVLACWRCNSAKGARLISTWGPEVEAK